METNLIKEVNVDNAIPLNKQKFITEPLILINDYLTRINRFTNEELKVGMDDEIHEQDNYDSFPYGNGVFDHFRLILKNQELKCYFGYNSDHKPYGIFFKWLIYSKNKQGFTSIEKKGGVGIFKSDLKNDLKRKKTAIWILLNTFSQMSGDSFVSYPSNCKTKEDLKKFYLENITGTEYSERIL